MPSATFTPTIDSAMEGLANPDTNYGSSTGVLCGTIFLAGAKSQFWRAIANFDVSSISGETITAAKLRRNMTIDYGAERAETIYRCTRPATWTEAGVTWNKYDGSNAWTAAGGDYDGAAPAPVGYTPSSGTGWQEITGLLAFVTDAIASRSNIVSIIMRLDDENPASADAHQWSSAQGGTPWELVVEYEGNRRRVLSQVIK